MDIQDVLRKIRERGIGALMDEPFPNTELLRWADAIEAAMREKDAEYAALLDKWAKSRAEIGRLTQERDAQYEVNVSMIAKHAKCEAEIELLTKLLTECAQYVPLNMMECNGHKCREPWCASCNDEADAQEAVDEANAVLQRVRSALAEKEDV